MRHSVAIALFILTAPLTAQVEHAPIVEKCQADQRLWLSQIKADPDSSSLPSFEALGQWREEMNDCQEVDPKNRWAYSNTGAEVITVQASRMQSFILRHNLWKQFTEEDTSGKR
jgi:hypothetical protein